VEVVLFGQQESGARGVRVLGSLLYLSRIRSWGRLFSFYRGLFHLYVQKVALLTRWVLDAGIIVIPRIRRWVCLLHFTLSISPFLGIKSSSLRDECWIAPTGTWVPDRTNQHPNARMDKLAPDAGIDKPAPDAG
jgi:hypothetical protein